jgi:NTP pyrophosphatase (non-canonical NTP hydrolase)
VWREADNAQGRLGWLQRLKDEVADVVIYCLSMSSAVGFDLAGAVQDKLQQNAEKYPADKVRGSARKYTELLKKEER